MNLHSSPSYNQLVFCSRVDYWILYHLFFNPPLPIPVRLTDINHLPVVSIVQSLIFWIGCFCLSSYLNHFIVKWLKHWTQNWKVPRVQVRTLLLTDTFLLCPLFLLFMIVKFTVKSSKCCILKHYNLIFYDRKFYVSWQYRLLFYAVRSTDFIL